jgi:uncharacterized protein involved in response to NO
MKPALVTIESPLPVPSAGLGMPLFRLGFRPFYLGAAACAAIFMGLWAGVYGGDVVLASGLPPVLWHAHEMLFGVVTAVIVGFLFTAGKTWTGLPTPRGALLGSLFLLWLSGRIASMVAPYTVYFMLDIAFLPIVAALFFDLLMRARNLRNLPIAAVLILLAATNLAYHLAASGALALPAVRALHAGIGLVVVLVSIIAGRVIPMFTMSVTPGLQITPHPRRDLAAIAISVTGLALWVIGVWPLASAALLLIAAALHTARLLSWSPWVSRRRPILWVLHVSYAWLCAGLALLAAAQAGWLPMSMGVHALTVGAISGMVIGMITRTARGHTGRPLQASKAEAAAYAMLLLAALVRVAAAAVPAPAQTMALIAAGGLWIGAFTLYLVRFAPWLVTPRVDGKDG